MSYTKREWAIGNVVGAVDLNRIEQGIEDAGSGQVLVVNSVYDSNNDSYTLDKTWQEIYDAFPLVVEYINDNGSESKQLFHYVSVENNTYYVGGNMDYTTPSVSGYPTTADGLPIEPDPGGGTIV